MEFSFVMAIIFLIGHFLVVTILKDKVLLSFEILRRSPARLNYHETNDPRLVCDDDQ